MFSLSSNNATQIKLNYYNLKKKIQTKILKGVLCLYIRSGCTSLKFVL